MLPAPTCLHCNTDCIVGVREGVIAPFLAFVTDDGFKTVCQMKWVINVTLPQSESTVTEYSQSSPP